MRHPPLHHGLLALALVLSGCGDEPDLPAPGAQGPMRLWHWDDSASAAPMRVHADRARVPETGLIAVDGIRLHLPLENGDWLGVHAATGIIDESSGGFTVRGSDQAPRLHLRGVVDGLPLAGTCQQLQTADHDSIVMHVVRLSHGGMQVAASRLHLHPGRRLQAENLMRRPDVVGMQVLQAAQPHSLTPHIAAE